MSGHRSLTRSMRLFRRAEVVGIGTEHTAIARLGAQQRATLRTGIHNDARIIGHQRIAVIVTDWTMKHSFMFHTLPAITCCWRR